MIMNKKIITTIIGLGMGLSMQVSAGSNSWCQRCADDFWVCDSSAQDTNDFRVCMDNYLRCLNNYGCPIVFPNPK